jgi:hypothetical protein
MSGYVPSSNSVHTDEILSTLATEYAPGGFIGPQLFTRIPVNKTSGSYRTRNKANLLTLHNLEVGDLGDPAELSATYGTAQFATEGYSAVERIPVTFENVADVPINLRLDATKQLKSSVMLAQEKRFADLLQATGSYAAANVTTLAGTDQWSDFTGSDPFDDIDTLLAALWAGPDAKKIAWAGYDTWQRLKNHPDLIERIKAGGSSDSPAHMTKKAFASLFGLDDFLVGDQRANTANPGQTASYSRIWGKHFGVVAVEPGSSTMFLGFGAYFVYQDARTFEWFNPLPGVEGANMIKMSHQVDEVVVANDAGILIANAVA